MICGTTAEQSPVSNQPCPPPLCNCRWERERQGRWMMSSFQEQKNKGPWQVHNSQTAANTTDKKIGSQSVKSLNSLLIGNVYCMGWGTFSYENLEKFCLCRLYSLGEKTPPEWKLRDERSRSIFESQNVMFKRNKEISKTWERNWTVALPNQASVTFQLKWCLMAQIWKVTRSLEAKIFCIDPQCSLTKRPNQCIYCLIKQRRRKTCFR